jgi:hypothetical protein
MGEKNANKTTSTKIGLFFVAFAFLTYNPSEKVRHKKTKFINVIEIEALHLISER